MDYYQGVVFDYLRADRSIFLNTECLIQLNGAANPDTSGPHWYCDAVAVNFGARVVFLCEISFAQGLGALLKRLQDWNANWPKVRAALEEDCKLPREWKIRPWIFVPTEMVLKAVSGIENISKARGSEKAMPAPRITTLEMVVPWKYKSWNRRGEALNEKPETIPPEMRT